MPLVLQPSAAGEPVTEDGGVGELSEMRGRMRPKEEVGIGVGNVMSGGGGEYFVADEIGFELVLIAGTGLLNTVVKLSAMEVDAEPEPVDGRRCCCCCCMKVLTPPFEPLAFRFH